MSVLTPTVGWADGEQSRKYRVRFWPRFKRGRHLAPHKHPKLRLLQRPLPPALDGVAAASGVAQGAGGGEDTSRAEASAGNGRNTSTPLENAFAGVAGVSADVHSADDAVGNPLMNASTHHCEGGSGQELGQGKTAGTAVPPISHASQAGDHLPSQINLPQSQRQVRGASPTCLNMQEWRRGTAG
jgi:hypothetical protein